MFHLTPETMTYGNFLSYLGQVAKIHRWEAGEDISTDSKTSVSKMTTEEFVEAVKSGLIKPSMSKNDVIKDMKTLTPEERKIEEAKIMAALGLGKQMPNLKPPVMPGNYGRKRG